jgi:hypothetical protein
LDDDQVLVTKVKLKGIDKKYKEQASEYVQKEIRPNSTINLFLYNLANAQNGHYRTQNVRNVGEAPSLLDSSLVDISSTQIQKYLNNKGFLNAQVKSEIHVRKKKAEVIFDIDQGAPFIIKSIKYDIEDDTLENIYKKYKPLFTKIRTGVPYDADSLVLERENIYALMQREGYFDFIRQYVRFELDTNMNGNNADLKLIIENPEGKSKHNVFYIDSSQVTIKDSQEQTTATPEITNLGQGIEFIDYSHNFKAKRLNRYIFMKEGSRFNIDNENLTYDRLYELNTFKSIKISYEKTDSTHLNAFYSLIPNKRMSNRLEGEFTFNSGRNGFNIGDIYTNRNFLGGSEQLEVKMSYGVLFDSRVQGNLLDKVFNQDIQLGATLTFPRLIVPFRIPQVVQNGMPRTTFSTSWQKFDQLNTYSNRYLINSISYLWNDTKYKVHNVTPIVLEYRLGKLSNSFKEELEKQGFGLYVASNDRAYIGLGSQYSYTYNTLRLSDLDNFIFFRGALDLSGNTLNLIGNLIKLPKNDEGQKTILNVPFLQYAKVETDFRVYRHFGGDRQLVLRLNPGIAVPYGNNTEFLIFEKSFYGGGMSGVRAWQARTLGPGGYNREVLPDSLRLNLRNLDQLGEIKLEGNIEYRFKLLNNLFGAKLKGATFIDVGNIWRLRESEINPNGKFEGNTFLGQMAIGTGLGLRFDVDYFVFRLDAGIKVRDPQFKGKDRWVISELFNSRDFRDRYDASHYPDRYNFIQYNFGIGMPF